MTKPTSAELRVKPMTPKQLTVLKLEQRHRYETLTAQGYEIPWQHETIERLLATIDHLSTGRDAVLEEAAQLVEASLEFSYPVPRQKLATKIRALKAGDSKD
jgi:hypothetical protein